MDGYLRIGPLEVGLVLLAALHAAHPDEFALDKSLPLLGSVETLELLRAGDLSAALEKSRDDASAFEKRRRDVLLYA